VSLVLGNNDDTVHSMSEAKQLQWDVQKRQFFGLTQVSRQVRTEYLPIYRTRTKIGIDHVEVHKYIDTILGHAGIQDKDLLGNVIVRFAVRPDHESPVCIDFDILPLIRLGNMADNFQLNFCPDLVVYDNDNEHFYEHTNFEVAGMSEFLVSLMAAADNTTIQ
jgi:hypothetical protein